MSYQLNRTDGTVLTDLIDGKLDKNSTNLVLVGKNYAGYGEFINENFIRLLENFSSVAPPSNPLSGQVWWDTSDERLKVFNGSSWKASGVPFVQSKRPNMASGDLWINNNDKQVYAYDGTDTILIGPQYKDSQGKSGFEIATIIDQQSRPRTVAKLLVGDKLTSVVSNNEFTPVRTERISELVTDENPDGIVYKGFNVVDRENFKFRGIAEQASAIVSDTGEVSTIDSFLPSKRDGVTTGTLTIQNSGGLILGLSQNTVHKIVGSTYQIENQLKDHDIRIRVPSSEFGGQTVDAIYVDSGNARVGIFNANRTPEYTLDVAGDLRVTGNMLVEGETSTINVNTLTVEDKSIELAKSDSTTLSSTEANNAGIFLNTSDAGTKSLFWKNSSNSWSVNTNFNIESTSGGYKINGVDKLTNTGLTNVQKALDLNEIGTLQYLNVDDIVVDGSLIKSNTNLNFNASSGINITSGGDINITDLRKITGLAQPTENQDAATKLYTDIRVMAEPIAFSLDITGLGSSAALEEAVREYLTDLYNPDLYTDGKIARIHTVSYDNVQVSGVDVEGIKNTTFVAVDSDGTKNQQVVEDVTFDSVGATGSATLSNVRGLMVYKSDGSVWSRQTYTLYN